MVGGMFPLFASRFLKEGEEFPRGDVVTSKHSPGHLGVTSVGPAKPAALRVLDLQTLPRDNGPPTELRTRKEKLAHYEQECSYVGDRLFVGGELVAKNFEVLQASHITHIVNCVGFLYPPYFESTYAYQTLYLQGKESCHPTSPFPLNHNSRSNHCTNTLQTYPEKISYLYFMTFSTLSTAPLRDACSFIALRASPVPPPWPSHIECGKKGERMKIFLMK